MSTDYNPFQSPAVPSQPNLGAAWPIMPFQSGHQRATIAMVLLAVTALLCVLVAIGSALQYGELQPQPNGAFVPSKTGTAIAEAIALLGSANFFVVVGTAIAFCMWTHRAARNLPALGGRGLKYTPGWAVGWFFIPLANLVMPYLVAAEIWQESDPAQRDLNGPGSKTTSPLVIGWWLAYITRSVPALVIAALTFQAAIKVASRQGSPEQVAAAINELLPARLLLTIAAEGLSVIAAILAIAYVYRVDANQQAKFDLLDGGGFAA